MTFINELWDSVSNFFEGFGTNILAAILIFVIGFFAIKLLNWLLLKIIYSTKIDNAVGGFFVAIVRLLLWVLVFFMVARSLGIDNNSFLVAFSSIALAVGLALKDSLANIANGIIIIMTKPFKKGDRISVDSVEGTVQKINILTTEIYTIDNKKIIIPNFKITSNSLTNHTSNPTRRIDVVFSVGYGEDMDKVKKVLEDVLTSNELVLKTPAPMVFMCAHSSSSVDFKVLCWVNTVDYWPLHNSLYELVFKAFKANNIEIPFNQLDVHVK